MATVIEIRARSLSTPGIISLASRPALARQAVVEARKAEGQGQSAEAASNYDRAFQLVTSTSWKSALLAPTRAAAAAGLARLEPMHPEAGKRRQDALAWLEHAAERDLDAADLADHALLIGTGDPLRASLVAQAAVAPRPLASLAINAAEDVTDPLTRFILAWSAVREAPKVPQHHVLLAGIEGRDDQDRSADYTVAAALFLDTGDLEQAREAAASAHRLQPANPVATVILADVLRLAGEPEEAIGLLSSLRNEPGLDPDLGVITARALARALELDGRRKDALEVIGEILDHADTSSEDFLFVADVRTLQGDFAGARDALDRALKIDPAGLPTITASVQYWLRAKRPDRAAADVEHALQSPPLNTHLWVLLGYINVYAGDEKGLDEQIKRVGELGLDAADAWSYASYLYEDQGDLRAAAGALDKALKLSPNDPELLARQGLMLLRLGDYESAIKVLRHRVKRRKTDAEPYQWLAQAWLATGQPEKAETVLNDAIGRLADDGNLIAWRGQVYRRLGNLADAERDLRRSLEYGPNPSWGTQLFWVLRDQGDEQTAAATLAECMAGEVGAVAVNLWNEGDYVGALAVADVGLRQSTVAHTPAEQAQLFMIRGLGEWQAGSRGDPEKSLRHAVAASPEYAQAHAFLGAYLVEAGRNDEAAAEVRRARDLDPGSEQMALVAADVLRKVDGDARALTELDEAIRQIGEDQELLVLRAVLLAELGRADDALALVTKLREEGIADPRLPMTQGLALTALGHYPEAVPILWTALEADPENAEVRLNLAYALNEVGEAKQAAEVLPEVDENTVDGRILRIRGRIRHSLRDKASLGDLSAALEQYPDWSDARIELIDAAVEFDENNLARQHFDVLIQDSSLENDPRMVRLAWLLGKPDLALERVQSILASAETRKPSMNGEACTALTYRSAILLERGEVTSAIDAARSAVELNDANPDARFVLSAALKAAGSPDEALAALGSEYDPQLVIQRVQLLLDIGHRQEAIRLVRRTVQTEQGNDRLATELLDTLRESGLLLQTARVLEPCLADRRSPWILRSAGLLLSAMGDFPRAVGILERARQTMSTLPDIDSSLAWAYSNLTAAQPRAVLTAANRALRKQPTDLYMLRTKADALLNIGRTSQARRLYRLIREELSSAPYYDGSLAGWCSYRLGEYERALDDLLRAISTSPQPMASERFDLGLVFFVAGRPSRAKREFSRAIEECRTLPSPLQRHGILQVAMVDLDDAIALGPADLNHKVAEQLKAMLNRQLKATLSSFAPVQAFLDRIDDVLKPGDSGPIATRHSSAPARDSRRESGEVSGRATERPLQDVDRVDVSDGGDGSRAAGG
jgi:tetratricopeptide (TPR) repeat protein